jgi:hypothetical protein
MTRSRRSPLACHSDRSGRAISHSMPRSGGLPAARQESLFVRSAAACKLLALAFSLLFAAACFAQDVKENKMGMPLAQFKDAHHSAHCYTEHFHKEELSPGEEMCRIPGDDLTLANVAVRSWKAYFYEGHLYRLLYEVDPKHYTDLYYVLIDLYGQPVTNAEEKNFAPPADLSESADYPFQFGDGWRAPAPSTASTSTSTPNPAKSRASNSPSSAASSPAPNTSAPASPSSSTGDMHINMWYTEATQPMYETPPKKNVTVEFVLQSVLNQLYKAGKPHKNRESL